MRALTNLAYQNLLESEERIDFQTETLPVCLSENPYRLVSLWKMLQVHAVQFTSLLDHLSRLDQNLGMGIFDSATVGRVLGAVRYDCEQLKLISALKQLERIRGTLDSVLAGKSTVNTPAMRSLVSELRNRVEEDLEESVFFQISSEHIHACFMRTRNDEFTEFAVMSPREFFGEQVLDNFSGASFDITEACHCYFSDASTACVFHLMRVLEIGLGALGNVFGVSLAHTNWAPALDQIESKIREMHKDPTWKVLPDCKEQQEFYAQAASHFGILKDAWRNYTAHARGQYADKDARLILENVRVFMQKLAMRLHE
jgi:hypothetical protein